MKKGLLFILVILISHFAFAQDFITRWDLSYAGSNANSITFGVGTTGTVNYTWETVPAGITGSGSFSGTTATITGLPTNAVIRLKINPTNFNQFKIGLVQQDNERLVDVEQWGAPQWSNFDTAFVNCNHLNITSTDIPDLSSVISTSYMFYKCLTLNGPTNIGSWNISNVTNLSYMFYWNSLFNQPIGNWNTSKVTDMKFMLCGANSFNQPIGNWITDSVNNMSGLFGDATIFNQPIANWNITNVKDISYMFAGANGFNQPINNWNTSNVTNMRFVFGQAYSFNQPLNNWNTTNVKDMSSMFQQSNFNQSIGNWNTSNVTEMSFMFAYTDSFNQPIGNWNITNVKNLNGMFNEAQAFNQPINNWNTANAVHMGQMFEGAISFNQPLNNWNTTNVTSMSAMFNKAISFNHSLGNWNLISLMGNQSMFDSSGLDCSNYSSTLHGWATNPNTPFLSQTTQPWIAFGSKNLIYGSNVQSDRDYLINTKGWYFLGDTLSSGACYPTYISNTNNNNSIQIYPNPSSTMFEILGSKQGSKKELFNTIGEMILSTTKDEIDVRHLNKGVYYLKIGNQTKKVIVE